LNNPSEASIQMLFCGSSFHGGTYFFVEKIKLGIAMVTRHNRTARKYLTIDIFITYNQLTRVDTDSRIDYFFF
jgi:hypothetical protein